MHELASIFGPVELIVTPRADGSTVLTNGLHLPETRGTIPERLLHWAAVAPERIFLSEMREGKRVGVSYGQAARDVERLAARLLHLPASSVAPLMLAGANSIALALVMLAAMHVGIPAAIVSPTYCGRNAAPWAKFDRLLDVVRPGLIMADDHLQMDKVLAELGHESAGTNCRPLRDLGWLEDMAPASVATLAEATAAVGLDTVAKLLFTSGSTGAPKAVMNTHRMMVSNMQGLALVWPFLNHRPPLMVDWLPWNHTFGGNCCFNLALYFGGTMHIDAGKPVPGQIDHTVAALRELEPTIYFNVPGGYEALLPHLEADLALSRKFFARVNFLFNAGAALPASIRLRIEQVSMRAIGRVPAINGGWGSTETAPFSTVTYFDTPHSTNLGLPLPGTEIKLVPTGGRAELRVRGPNVMPGYWNDPVATAATFDEEGFYCIGDAGRLADPDRPEAGILFDGRVAENFKLVSGTWVNVGALRLAVIAAAGSLVSDAVLAGEGRSEIRLLVFVNETAARGVIGAEVDSMSYADVVGHPEVVDRVRKLLCEHNAKQIGSSTRIAGFEVMREPPSALGDEITDKGYINQGAVLRRRAQLVEMMYQRMADLPAI